MKIHLVSRVLEPDPYRRGLDFKIMTVEINGVKQSNFHGIPYDEFIVKKNMDVHIPGTANAFAGESTAGASRHVHQVLLEHEATGIQVKLMCSPEEYSCEWT